ncbi:MAG TPA: ethanolamine ammonia-lyase reactivating factor EutA, partial [Candidatus Hodarchaeales archaeon]|nr:ethanolamine ammonia-lyase reactivating factor EutA [Candidatus Hodarchaeales archaeon]
MNVTSKIIKSVGIDIGTSTTKFVVSELLLTEDPQSRTRKFFIADRNILYRSPIHLTPLLDFRTIDAEKISAILENEYHQAGIDISQIETGAVIITGETARKENADAVVRTMAEHAGKFVAATAGPNFESAIACQGAGLPGLTLGGKTVLHTNIGGGTSNSALVSDGRILATSAINVGGRLIVFEINNRRVTKFEKAAKVIADSLKVSLEIGLTLSENDIHSICQAL